MAGFIKMHRSTYDYQIIFFYSNMSLLQKVKEYFENASALE